MSLTPLDVALNALTLALKDSADAFGINTKSCVVG